MFEMLMALCESAMIQCDALRKQYELIMIQCEVLRKQCELIMLLWLLAHLINRQDVLFDK